MDKLLKAVKQADRLDQNLWAKLRDLVERYWADAEVTGDGYFAVGVVCHFGNRLLRLRPGHHVLQILHAWAVRALDVEPYNAHPWGLWAKVLADLDRRQDSLAVRWEAARRFPDDPVIRTELADALLRAKQPLVAERLLRQSMADFPDNAWCRNMLAQLLRETDRVDEAEAVLRQSMADSPDNEVPRNMLAELLCNTTGREREAEELFHQTMKTFPGDEVCRTMLVYLLCRQGRYAEAERPFREAEALDPNNSYVRDLAVRLGFSTPADGNSSELDQPPPHFHLRPDRWGQTLRPGETSGDGETVAPWPDSLMPHFYGHPNLREKESHQEDSPAVPPTATDVARRPREQTATGPPTVPTAPEAVLPSAAAVLERYLAQLMKRVPWLEHYFADGAPNLSETDDGSELALVVEYRRSAQPEIALADKLNLAARLRPGAYSVQLLYAWQHRENRDWPKALADLAKAFPEQHHWHNWLRYPDLSVVEQKKVLDAFQKKRGKQNNAASARQEKSRLASVYPQLFCGVELPHTNPQALRRLVEDIAFACSDETVPAVPT